MNTPPVINRRARQHFDIPLLLVTFALAAFGVLAVTVATYSTNDEALAKKVNSAM